MKYHTTKKEINNGYYYIIGISYCNAQNLLNYKNAESYCAGVYGWSCDNYNVNNTCISTGYNYINNKNTKYEYELLKEYDLKAESIICDSSIPYNQKADIVNDILVQFIELCKMSVTK